MAFEEMREGIGSLDAGAPDITYEGNEGPQAPQQMTDALLKEEYDKYVYDLLEQRPDATPMSFEEFKMMVIAEGKMSGGQPLPQDPTKPINPFQPKPTGPVLPDRQMAAYGGIMGLDGRKQYGIGSWFQEKIMDPIKENPLLTAAAAALGYNTYQNTGTRGDFEDSILGKGIKALTKKRMVDIYDKDDPTKVIGQREGTSVLGDIGSSLTKNIVPIVGGLTAGIFTNNQPEQPGLPDDTTAIQLADLKKSANILDQKQAMAAGLNFTPAVSARKYTPAEMIETYATQSAANGGRLGFDNGGGFSPNDLLLLKRFKMNPKEVATYRDGGKELLKSLRTSYIPKAEGGIMDLGGMEKDYRNTGGFVDIGEYEKKDDVPARLSVNEFVMTADAVRGMGDGDIDLGAKRMENLMGAMENKKGAQQMFETSERLSEVI